MILNRRDNTPVVPREKVQKSELARLYIQLKEQKQIIDKIHRTSILVLQNWMEKHKIGMRQLPIVLEVYVNTGLRSLPQELELLEHLQRSFKCVTNDTY